VRCTSRTLRRLVATTIARDSHVDTRRQFLKSAALLSGAAGLAGVSVDSIRRALAIEPESGSTFWDAEHVVILMQENRSFDHAFGTLKGVRGFDDPRILTLPNGDPVWVQTNRRGESYVPFRLDIKNSNATWLGCLPHGRTDQVDARNGGRYDRWLDAKQLEGNFADLPFVLGHYTREDIPFYYELADAFTICDQHFCSALSSTTPNRLYLWSGTVREKQTADSPAKMYNDEAVYDAEVSWPTFPERLEDLGISWKVYQNEISLPSGLEGEYQAWLANFDDNPLEYFTQYNVRFSEQRRGYLEEQAKILSIEIKAIEQQIAAIETSDDDASEWREQLATKTNTLRQVDQERLGWSAQNFEKLSKREKNIHLKAFATNVGDSDYRQLVTHKYYDGGRERQVQMPKGDVFHSFRDDVRKGKLPTVSWLVAPERFSDHPGSAWYGAWYIAETLGILTENPEVWKKTIFILTYDENDGYFDHVPPFVAPHPRRPETGIVSPGIDTSVDYVDREEELKLKRGRRARESPIGLGYRVPMIIASPWSRGGCVCSQVFDHTSVLQFLETLLTHKIGRPVEEPNISKWRRTVCGDLTSAFQTCDSWESGLPPVTNRSLVVEEIHRARFKDPPSNFKILTDKEIEQLRRNPRSSPLMPRQEPGVRRSSALPYELSVDGSLSAEKNRFVVRFEARNKLFGKRAAGSPFVVYARTGPGTVEIRDYAVAAGSHLEDSWALAEFEDDVYDIRVHGPNGFYREFRGAVGDARLDIRLQPARLSDGNSSLSGNVELQIINRESRPCDVEVLTFSYSNATHWRRIAAGELARIEVESQQSFGWYDLGIHVAGNRMLEYRFAGRVETGKWTFSDPLIGASRVNSDSSESTGQLPSRSV
jgi:phospholipase C